MKAQNREFDHTGKKYALISVHDKRGVEELASRLAEFRVILATGGTARYLESRGVKVRRLSEITGIEESRILKTLHPRVFEMIAKGEIDVVVVNLYPFSEKPCVENIDIGGVTLLRAAAKNFERVFAISKRSQYREVIEKFPDVQGLKRRYACEAFKLVSEYDRLIAEWFCMDQEV